MDVNGTKTFAEKHHFPGSWTEYGLDFHASWNKKLERK